jgi:phage tail-like protein
LYDLAAAGADRVIRPGGEVYPLLAEALEAPFVHRQDGPPHYPVALGDGVRGSEPLHALSLPNLARHGEARHFDGDGHAQLIDSGNHQTVWHRLYAEARLLPQTGFIAWLAATAEPQPPAPDAVDAWLPHPFGDVPDTQVAHIPSAAWENAASEIPHHPGVAQWPQERGRAGLWSILIQNPHRRVRRLVGRFLWLRVEMFGDGRIGPEIAALRAWSSRFSYRDQYLPRLYRESVHGAVAALPGEAVTTLDASHRASLDVGGAPAGTLAAALDQAGLDLGETAALVVQEAGQRWALRDPGSRRGWQLRNEAEGVRIYRPQATQADFLERMLGNFEGMLTPIEDRIAAAHVLTDPDGAPDENLEWIGAWIGVAFDPLLPVARRRAWLGAAPQLARLHGTRQGLELALDLASGGAVKSGEIVVIEDFRLRRLLATLLGVELEVEDDPLLPGLIVSGNSVVGDTLMLGEAETAELMALFRADTATEAENSAVIDFDARLAHRATVLVHQAVEPQDLGLLRRVAELEAPAHVDLRVVSATWPLMVGIASLVGVDTYLGPRPSQRPARVSGSLAGRDFVIGPAVLDPRMAGATAMTPPALPVADAGDDFDAEFGASFTLDGSRSHAAPGRHLTTYRWRRLPSD